MKLTFSGTFSQQINQVARALCVYTKAVLCCRTWHCKVHWWFQVLNCHWFSYTVFRPRSVLGSVREAVDVDSQSVKSMKTAIEPIDVTPARGDCSLPLHHFGCGRVPAAGILRSDMD